MANFQETVSCICLTVIKYPHSYQCPLLSCVQCFSTLWTVAHQAHVYEFSTREYWSGFPFPPPRDLSDPGNKPESPSSPTLAGRFFTTAPSGKPPGGRSPGEEKSYPLQYFCLENSTDRGAWWDTVHGAAKSQT